VTHSDTGTATNDSHEVLAVEITSLSCQKT